MRLVESSVVAAAAALLLGSLGSGCFIVPECTGCVGTGGAGGRTASAGANDENCTDGVDNDGDGAIDCADSDCSAGFECVDVPSGWDGPYLVREVGYVDELPDCADGSDTILFFAEPSGPAECSECTCNQVPCLPAISCWPADNCDGQGVDLTDLLADGECHKPVDLIAKNVDHLSCRLTGAPPSCVPSGVDFSNKDPWKKRVGLCELPAQSGCDVGQVCVARDGEGFSCLMASDDVSCPTGPFHSKRLVYSGHKDSRKCKSCACGEPSCATVGYKIYDHDDCTTDDDEPITVDSDTCTKASSWDVLDSDTWALGPILPLAQGSCEASGGEADGKMEPVDPVTLCCQP